MTKKLFYVEVTKSGWVLAEDETSAKAFADEILDTEYLKDIDVFPYSDEYLKASGWDENCYVYHSNSRTKDIKLGDVIKND